MNNRFFRLWRALHKRRNWFGDTPRGARATAIYYSLMETAKADGLEPYACLHRVLQHIAAADTLENLEASLPWNMKQASHHYRRKGAESLVLTAEPHRFLGNRTPDRVCASSRGGGAAIVDKFGKDGKSEAYDNTGAAPTRCVGQGNTRLKFGVFLS